MKSSNFSLLVAAIALTVSTALAYSIRVKHSCANSGHNFEARYSKVMPDTDKIEAVKSLWETISKNENARGGIDLKFEELYQGETCTYCGTCINAD